MSETPDTTEAACPKCEREWPHICEQTICIDRHGECVCCKFVNRGEHTPHGSGYGTTEELDAISAANKAANI